MLMDNPSKWALLLGQVVHFALVEQEPEAGGTYEVVNLGIALALLPHEADRLTQKVEALVRACLKGIGRG